MIWVKVCGITSLDDALMVADAGADAIGFVLDPTSPRFVPHSDLERIVSRLSRAVKSVAVFGEFIPSSVVDLFDYLQAFNPPAGFEGKRIQTRRPSPGLSVAELAAPPERAEMILLDAFNPNASGGTGHVVDTDLARQVVQACDFQVILAGGLTPETIAGTIQLVHPYGVDVSSGVEIAPGKKDPEKVRRFIRSAKQAAPANV